MIGINLNKPIEYLYSSLRFFDENEMHVTRLCEDDVLLLVYEGILRFDENGIPIEVNAGEYYIQKAGGYQAGTVPSDSPKYLYVHFKALWCDGDDTLKYKGDFNYAVLRELMERLDNLSHSNATFIEQSGVFYDILATLFNDNITIPSLADDIADYLKNNLAKNVTLTELSEKFHFSKNHIINIFKEKYAVTPFEYLSDLRIGHASRLLEVTSKTTEAIAEECGFNNYSHFYKTFYKKNMVSPKQWRNHKRIKPVITN